MSLFLHHVVRSEFLFPTDHGQYRRDTSQWIQGAQTSMIGASYCCHVTLLILLLLLRFAFANVNSNSVASSSSSSFSSSPSSSTPLSSPTPLLSSSFVSPSLSKSTLFDKSSRVFADSSNEAPPSPNHSQSLSPPSISNSQSGNDVPAKAEISHSSQAMKATPSSSSSTSERPKQTTPTNDLTITKRAKFKLGATEKEKKILAAVEKLFLKNVGLPNRPRITSEYAVPEYMLDLYKAQVQNTGAANPYLKVKGKGLVAANTVRSFLHTDTESTKCRPPLCSRVFFDVNTIPEQETVTGAELRIFADVSNPYGDESFGSEPSAQPSDGAIELSKRKSPADLTTHRIEIHEIMRPVSPDGDVISRLIDTRVVNLRNSSWQSFDIHPAVLKWKRGEKHNHGLEIRLVSKTPTLSTDKHVRIRRAVHLPDKVWALQRPLLVTYTDDGSSLSSSSSSSSTMKKPTTRLRRRRRNSDDDKEKRKRRRRKNRKRRKKKRRRKKKGNKNICKRHGLYVDFNDVGWDDWIVAPTGYSAYYCHGDCMAPLPYFSKASNHAMLQARVYKVNPSAVPMVCCVPIKMSPISMLYRDEKGRTVLKNYQDMTVEECGCK